MIINISVICNITVYGLIRYVQILILLVCLLLEAFQKLDSFIIRGL